MLIRALEPTAGLEAMRERRGERPDGELCSGPGKLTEALGIGLERNGADLGRDPFRLLGPEGAGARRSSPARGSASPKRSSAPGASAPPAAASSRGRGPSRAGFAPTARLAGGDATAATGFGCRFRCGFGGFFRRRFDFGRCFGFRRRFDFFAFGSRFGFNRRQ